MWTDGRTYGQADGHLRPTLLGRLGGVDLKRLNVERFSNTYTSRDASLSSPGDDATK